VKRGRSAPLDLAPTPRARLGHNNGPPLDASWSGWVWRRASKRAWKTPPREVAMLRLKRAEAVGLGYRDVTLVLKDRGRLLAALVAAPGLDDPRVAARLARLGPERVVACTASADADAASLARAIEAALAARGLLPQEVAMIGASARDLAAAERARLALFRWAEEWVAA
jgi:phosphoglycolate phosphatase-like HAD superfamily hydrolase